MLAVIDRDKLHQFVNDKGGVETLTSDYRKVIEIFSAFMGIYPNILPAETYMRYKTPVIFGEILLFILRQELRSENMHSVIHPRFYKKVGQTISVLVEVE